MESPIKLFHQCKKKAPPDAMWAWKEARLFDITSVVNDFFRKDDSFSKADDFQALTPPFPVTWLEYSYPESIWNDEDVALYRTLLHKDLSPQDMRFGALCVLQDVEDVPDLRWDIQMGLYAAAGNKIFVEGEFVLRLTLDERGDIGWLERPTGFSKGARGIFVKNEHPISPFPMDLFLPYLYSLMLLNCRNVSTQENTQKRTLKRRKNRKVQTRTVETRYHTLVVKPMRSRGGNGAGTGGHKAMHVRRGAFRDYRENGLFGRHKGIYYFGPTVVGSKQDGAVEKDYQVRVK